MNIKNTPANIALSILVTIALAACNLRPTKPGIWKNNTIPEDKRAELHAITDSLFSYLKAGNDGAVESLLSANLLENNYNKRTRQLVTNHIKADKYTLQNEFYVVNRLYHKEFIKPKTDSLGVNYTAVAKEMYLAFYLPKASPNQQMVTLVLGKFDYGWRIEEIELNPYTKNGKTATQLYQTAKQQYENGYLVDAVNTMSWAVDCSRPSEEIIYPNDAALSLIYNKVINEANEKYKFPLVLKDVPGKPAIFRFTQRELKDGAFPVISYLSKIDIKDTAAVRQQNDAVQKVIGTVFKGVDKDKKFMIYDVYNEMPNVHSNSYSYTIIHKLQ